jgi:hypothetical protein
METEFIRKEVIAAWDWLESIVRDVTEEQANWWPPGNANSIGITYVHIVINTDVEVGRMVYGRDPLIETRWKGQAGTGIDYDLERFDDTWKRGALVDWGVLRGYGRAVHEMLAGTLDSLTAEVLERPVDMTRSGLGIWTARDIYRLHGWNHVRMHGGEIACLKGLQGSQGYVGGVDTLRPDWRPGAGGADGLGT